jgi:hypothetical protein
MITAKEQKHFAATRFIRRLLLGTTRAPSPAMTRTIVAHEQNIAAPMKKDGLRRPLPCRGADHAL